MSGLSDMMEGLKMMHQGIQDYQTNQAVTDAAQQVQAMNSQKLEEKDRAVQAANISNDLALRLTGAGVEPGRIAQATAGLAPSANQQLAMTTEQQMNTAGIKSKEKEGQANRDNALVLAGMKQDGAAKKQDDKLLIEEGKFPKEFASQPQVKPLLEGLPKINHALDLLKKGRGEQGATAIMELAKLGLIKDFAGRVNEQEIQAANETQSGRAQMWKKLQLEKTGDVPLTSQDFWIKIMQRTKNQSLDDLRTAAQGFSQAKATSNPKHDAGRIHDTLTQQYGLAKPPNPNQARIDMIKEKLSNPSDADKPYLNQLQLKLKRLEEEGN